MVEFFVVRHGQSLGNANGIFVGQTDIDLSQLGHNQAKKTGLFLSSKKIDAIYTSDLKRAYHTAEHIKKYCSAELIASKNLREINAGAWQGRKFDYLEQNFENYKTWLSDIGNAVCDGGESVKEMQSRINEEFVKIACENENKTVCVVTHAAPIRVMNCLWNNVSLNKAFSIPWVSNCSVTNVCYDGNAWSVKYIGSDEHLKELKSCFPSNV